VAGGTVWWSWSLRHAEGLARETVGAPSNAPVCHGTRGVRRCRICIRLPPALAARARSKRAGTAIRAFLLLAMRMTVTQTSIHPHPQPPWPTIWPCRLHLRLPPPALVTPECPQAGQTGCQRQAKIDPRIGPLCLSWLAEVALWCSGSGVRTSLFSPTENLLTPMVRRTGSSGLLNWKNYMQLTTKSVSKMADASLLHAAVSQDLSASYSRALDTVRSKLLLKVRN